MPDLAGREASGGANVPDSRLVRSCLFSFTTFTLLGTLSVSCTPFPTPSDALFTVSDVRNLFFFSLHCQKEEVRCLLLCYAGLPDCAGTRFLSHLCTERLNVALLSSRTVVRND